MASAPPPSTPPSLPAAAGASSRGRYLRVLTNAQLGSGLLFSSFALVHLISPVLIAVTGEERAGSSFMLLGRVFYQTPLSEPLLVYGSLVVHVGASIAKRLLSRSPWQGLRSSHSLSGFLLVPPVLTHLLTHRVGPASSAPPIHALSPAEMDYTFAAAALAAWPALTTVTYGALVGLGLWHALGGLAIVRRRWGGRLAALLPRFARRSTAPAVASASPSTAGVPRAARRSALVGGRMAGTLVGLSVLAVSLYRLQKDAFVPAQLHRRVVASHRAVLPWLYK